jgi:glutathione S-transferase
LDTCQGGRYQDGEARAAALKFRLAFDELEQRLASQPFLLGDSVTPLDIAWFVDVNRLMLAAYPFARLHPRVADWFARLRALPKFAKEVELPPPLTQKFASTRREHAQTGKSLEIVAGF